MKSCLNELMSILREGFEDISVVVTPDFFLDRLITLKQTPSEFSSAIKEVASRKGGSLDNIPQTDIHGGNAVNTALALATLGARVTPIVCTSELGMQQLAFHFKPLGVDSSHIKIRGKASLTTALELTGAESRVNIMLRDLGSLADFSPRDLSDEDYEAIKAADYTCISNWAGTRNYGTELAQKVFGAVKATGRGKTYLDTADPTPNRGRIPELIEKVLKTKQVDILSLNESEAITYGSYLTNRDQNENGPSRLEEKALESARLLAKHLPARIDLHATSFSATFTKQHEVIVPAFRVKPLRATGAGDAWNAGNILADANNLSDENRLTFANGVSACYLTDPKGAHPTSKDLILFFEKQNHSSSLLNRLVG